MRLLRFCVLILLLQQKSLGKRLESTGANLFSNERILGGQDAEIGFAKYQVSLQPLLGYHNCGGSILNNQWILTAGHCVVNFPPAKVIVVTGTNRYARPGAIYETAEIHLHCSYDKPNMNNDIALLKLTQNITFDELTQPIQLTDRPLQVGDEIMLTGWGAFEPNGILFENLQKLSMGFVKLDECMDIFNHTSSLGIGHICTFSKEGEGGCHGDSGGPLVTEGRLVGIVNWGRPCARGFPDVQASVHYYLEWIRRTMSGNSKC